MLVPELDWKTFALALGSSFENPDSFTISVCHHVTRPDGEKGKETADRHRAANTVLSYNLRIYVLTPLVCGEKAQVLPLQNYDPCCRRWLPFARHRRSKRTVWRIPNDKKRANRAERIEIIYWIKTQHVEIPVEFRERAIEDPGGDAVDALLAIVATRNGEMKSSRTRTWTDLQPTDVVLTSGRNEGLR